MSDRNGVSKTNWRVVARTRDGKTVFWCMPQRPGGADCGVDHRTRVLAERHARELEARGA